MSNLSNKPGEDFHMKGAGMLDRNLELPVNPYIHVDQSGYGPSFFCLTPKRDHFKTLIV